MSASTTPTESPDRAMAAARLTVTEDFPTPPLPEAMAKTRVSDPGLANGISRSTTPAFERSRDCRAWRGAAVGDVDRLDHPEVGDRSADLGVVDGGECGLDGVTSGHGGCCGHGADA